MATLTDTPELRRARDAAYEAGAYKFRAPPVYSGNWDRQAWQNWVTFDDAKLTGFLPYVNQHTARW